MQPDGGLSVRLLWATRGLVRGRKSAHPNTRKAFNLMHCSWMDLAVVIFFGTLQCLNAAPVHIAIFTQVFGVILLGF